MGQRAKQARAGDAEDAAGAKKAEEIKERKRIRVLQAVYGGGGRDEMHDRAGTQIHKG